MVTTGFGSATDNGCSRPCTGTGTQYFFLILAISSEAQGSYSRSTSAHITGGCQAHLAVRRVRRPCLLVRCFDRFVRFRQGGAYLAAECPSYFGDGQHLVWLSNSQWVFEALRRYRYAVFFLILAISGDAQGSYSRSTSAYITGM